MFDDITILVAGNRSLPEVLAVVDDVFLGGRKRYPPASRNNKSEIILDGRPYQLLSLGGV